MTLLLGIQAGHLGSLLGCIVLADISPGVSVPLAKAPEPVVAVDLRLVSISPDGFEPPEVGQWEFPVVAGAGLRTKFHSDLKSFALGPQGCAAAVRANANTLPVLCAGASLGQLEWIGSEFRVGVGSPYLEPAVGFRFSKRQGALVVSMPIEYMVRLGQPNVAYLGVRLGWGSWDWMHSSETQAIVNDALGDCTGF